MLILCENEISKTQFNHKISEKISEKLDFSSNFSMFYVYYLDTLSDFTDSEFSIVKKLLQSEKFNIKEKCQNYFFSCSTSWSRVFVGDKSQRYILCQWIR